MKSIILIALVAVVAIHAAELPAHQRPEWNMFEQRDPNSPKPLADPEITYMLIGIGHRPSALEISQILDRAVNVETYVRYQDLKRFSHRSDCREVAMQKRALEAKQMIPDRNARWGPNEREKLLSDYARAALEETVKRCIKGVAYIPEQEQKFLANLGSEYRKYAPGHTQSAAGCPEYPSTLTNYEQFILQGTK